MKTAILCFPKIDWKIQFPVGLFKIQQYCRNDYKIFIVDERIVNAEITITRLCEQNDVICLGLSVMTGEQINSAIRLSKQFHSKLPIVWGGVHPTICPESVISQPYVDYIIRGDGEEAFRLLLSELEQYSGCLPKDRATFFEHNLFYLNNLNSAVIDFEKAIIPSEYFISRDGFTHALPLETSRGCPYKCAFCHNAIYGQNYRTVDLQSVIHNINQMAKIQHVDGIIFQEDNFLINKTRVQSILNELNRCGIGWKANGRIDCFKRFLQDPDFMSLLLDSNCHVLQFGIESGSQRILNMINKQISIEDIREVNKELAHYDIALRYNFIIGLPTETQDEIGQTLNLIHELQCENPHVESPFVNIYSPYPGTRLYQQAIKCGFNAPANLEQWASISWNTPNPTLNSPEMCEYLNTISNTYLNHSAYPR